MIIKKYFYSINKGVIKTSLLTIILYIKSVNKLIRNSLNKKRVCLFFNLLQKKI